MVAIMPASISFLTTSPALTPIALASSPTVITSEMRTTRLLALGVRDLGLLLLLARAARASCAAGAPERFSRSLISANSGFWMTRRFFFLPRAAIGRRPAAAPAGASAGGRRPRAASARRLGARARAATRSASAFFRSIRPSTLGPNGRSAGSVRAGAAAAAGGAAVCAARRDRRRFDHRRRRAAARSTAAAPRREPTLLDRQLARLLGHRRQRRRHVERLGHRLQGAEGLQRHRDCTPIGSSGSILAVGFGRRRRGGAAADDLGADAALDQLLAGLGR